MTLDELWKKLTGRTVAQYAADLEHWERVQKPALLRDIHAACAREGITLPAGSREDTK